MSVGSSGMIVTFLEDTDELLGQIEEILVGLEKSPGNIELLNTLFRAIHTLKGSASFMGFKALSSFSHELENLLHSVRSGDIDFGEKALDVVFKSMEVFKGFLEDIRREGHEAERDVTGLTVDIQELVGGGSEEAESRAKEESLKEALPPEAEQDSWTVASKLVGVRNVSGSMLMSMLSSDIIDRINASPGTDKVYHLRFEIEVESSMPVARAMMVIREFDVKTTLLIAVPPVEYLEEEFNGTIDLLVLTDMDDNSIKEILQDKKIRLSTIEVIDRSETGESEHRQQDKEIDRPGKSIEKDDRTASDDEESIDETVKIDAEVVMEGPGPPDGESVGRKNDRSGEEMKEEDAGSEEAGSSEPVEEENGPGVDSGETAIPEVERKRREFIRVDIQKLDSLMNLVGELVTNRTANYDLLMKARSESDESDNVNGLIESFQEQGRIIYEIQEGIMNSRLVPVASVFNSVPLVVREIARETGKSVECRISGESTELDKKLVDSIREAIMHLVRNSIDHGIEYPNERREAGKSETGKLEVNAYQEYNQIVINIKDDGGGIDRKKIVKKAVERNLISFGDEAKLTDKQIMSLLFQPGFSTSDKVTSRSGRGVGMDVVKREVEDLKGSVEVLSEHGVGTTVTLRLPITLAIIQGLLVQSGDKVFAIPISSVSEIVMIEKANIHKSHNGGMLFKMRDTVIDLFTLEELLGLGHHEPGEVFHVVVINNLGRMTGIIVDGLLGEREIVIKNLKNEFLNVDGIAGASITGDGRVILIIDIPVLVRKRMMLEDQMDLRILTAEMAELQETT